MSGSERVFVSHSEVDDAPLDNVTSYLENHVVGGFGVAWNKVRGGMSVRESIRKGILQCDILILIATEASKRSEWCPAEVGAAWGQGKSVVVYRANGLRHEALAAWMTPEVKSVETLSSLKEAVLLALADAEASRLDSGPRMIGDLTYDELESRLRSLLGVTSLRVSSRIGRTLWLIRSWAAGRGGGKKEEVGLWREVQDGVVEHMHSLVTRTWGELRGFAEVLDPDFKVLHDEGGSVWVAVSCSGSTVVLLGFGKPILGDRTECLAVSVGHLSDLVGAPMQFRALIEVGRLGSPEILQPESSHA